MHGTHAPCTNTYEVAQLLHFIGDEHTKQLEPQGKHCELDADTTY